MAFSRTRVASESGAVPQVDLEATKSVYDKTKTTKFKPARVSKSSKKAGKSANPALTPSTSDHEEQDMDMPDLTDAEEATAAPIKARKAPTISRRQSGRSVKRRAVNYADGEDEED